MSVAQVMETLWPQSDDERGRVRALASGEAKEQSGPVLDAVGSASVEVNMTLQTSSQPPGGGSQASVRRERKAGNTVGALIIAGVALLVSGIGGAYFLGAIETRHPAASSGPRRGRSDASDSRASDRARA